MEFNNMSLEPENFVRTCIICGSPYTQIHHIFGGTARRKISDRYGFVVPLCQEHHTGRTGVHQNRDLDLKLKREAQEYYEQHYGSRTDFIQEFGKGWIDE